MGRARIVLAGVSPKLTGLKWESDTKLRIGRQETLDIVLQDVSVNRVQAEVFFGGRTWSLRDLADSPRYPTLLNGSRVGRSNCPLKRGDVLQCGNMVLQVESVEDKSEDTPPPTPVTAARALTPGDPETQVLRPPDSGSHIKTSGAFLRVQATAAHSWDEALETVALDVQERPRQGQHMLSLLRTGFHLSHAACLDDLLHSVLEDALGALGAQRGAIVLADAEGQLKMRAVLGVLQPPNTHGGYSRTLAERCFRKGQSMLCQDVAADESLVSARSILRGSMSSIICALLRSPRRRLGVLHLDRGPFQEPFGQADFYLADAMAASVAVGIESALLVEQQRDEFVQMVTSLARAVEMRDQYTGGHTRRVTDYALLLADELHLSPQERYQIQIGGPLHDIGKIGVDDAILRKPGKLTPAEFEQMKLHTVKGAHILQSIASLTAMIPIVRHHHERWDGKGYPDGLKGEQIAQTARIVAVADAFDAMTSDRPYRPGMSPDLAWQEIARDAGAQFDPQCVEAFLRLRPRILELMQRG
jgi:hypothetical protein